ncbi:MAG TPA: hypothetical protein VGN83_23430 [Falsiroseomonas sp.]|jgi:hypothetical protein|nr:hypothetical protein [Falsiroseomonas sp.]
MRLALFQQLRRRSFAGIAILAISVSDISSAGAEETADCWNRFFRERSVSRPVGEIATFDFVGRTFRIPTVYLSRGSPQPALREDDAVWLLAMAPDLAPPTVEQARNFWRPSSPTVRITIFGHPRFLRGQALLDAMVAGYGHKSQDGERDANGYTVLRAPSPTAGSWAEIHVSPEGPDHLFHCNLDGSVPYPGCTAQRWLGGSLRLEMHFRKPLIPDYPALNAALASFMRCALGLVDVPGEVWPQAERRR